MPLRWPRPKGCVKCPVLQPVAQMLRAEAVGVGAPAPRGRSPSLHGATGARRGVQPSRRGRPPAPLCPSSLGWSPCGVGQELGSGAGREGRAGGTLQAGTLARWPGISQSIGCEC